VSRCPLVPVYSSMPMASNSATSVCIPSPTASKGADFSWLTDKATWCVSLFRHGKRQNHDSPSRLRAGFVGAGFIRRAGVDFPAAEVQDAEVDARLRSSDSPIVLIAGAPVLSRVVITSGLRIVLFSFGRQGLDVGLGGRCSRRHSNGPSHHRPL
jgi:hypothetical protein